MPILIVYDSLYGNTALASERLLSRFPGSLLKSCKECRVEEFLSANGVIVATPTHAARASKAMLQFLRSLPPQGWQGKKTAVLSTGLSRDKVGFLGRCFIYLTGYAAEPTLIFLLKRGAIPAGRPLNLSVAGERGPIIEEEWKKLDNWHLSF